MTMRSWKVLTALALLLGVSPALGQSPPDEKAGARLLFQRGLTHVREGNLIAALEAFRRAYATQPHFSVLYNIGQAQAALGQSTEAIATFELYLAEAGEQIAEPRRAEVRGLLEAQRKRLGTLQLHVPAPERTRIWLDGIELGREQFDRPIALSIGEHTLLYSTGSGHPATEKVSVTSGTTTGIRLPSPLDATAPVGQLAVVCDAPDIAVIVDDRPAGKTPIVHPLLLPVGSHQVRFSRVGYRAASQQVDVTSGRFAIASCDARPEAPLAPANRARLSVRTTPRYARVFIDGQPFNGEALPSGRHALRIELDGYQPHRTAISLKAGTLNNHQVVLVPTPAERERQDAARRERRTVAYAGWATGAAALITAGSIFWWNQGRYQAWQAENRRSGAPNFDRIASIQRVDDISFGLVILGAGLTAGGTWAFFTSKSGAAQ